MDVCVAAARNEGFGLTPLEAMASGTPAIATKAGAFEEQIVSGESGYIFEIDDADSLKTFILDLASNPAKCAQFAVAGRKRVQVEFDILREVREINAVYRSLLDV